jgi:signal transduction histidine kinase
MSLAVIAAIRAERLETTVTDTGPGIQREHLDHVFEPLFSTLVFSVGLGLALVSDI